MELISEKKGTRDKEVPPVSPAGTRIAGCRSTPTAGAVVRQESRLRSPAVRQGAVRPLTDPLPEVRDDDPPVSASLGAMGSLAGKLLDALQDAELKAEIGQLTDNLLKLSKAWDPPVEARIWMKDVRELSYDMENCIDLAEPDWVSRMSGFKARVKEANQRYVTNIPGSIPVSAVDFQIPMVDGLGRRPDVAVVGLDDGLFGKLRRWLMTDDDDKALKVASIVGVGGIGKTTLAKQLWREHKPGGYFACRAFVRTAKKPDMRRFLRSILAQVRPHQPPDTNEVHQLIHDLNTHLQGKRYLLIIDDLWATSVWDVARRAFPKDERSRIIITTEIKDVALACCRYQSENIFNMEPLSGIHSEELFISIMFASGEEKSRQFDDDDDVFKEIIRRCAGLPLAIISISSVLASQKKGEANATQHREQLQNILPTNATPVEVLKQALNFCYKCLPRRLQTCLLYLSFYPDNYIVFKEDIVKQWVAEGFILAPRDEDEMKVAGNYFDKLVNMGLIQHIDVGYSNDVYYYAVHPMVHDLITSKSREENFITVIDYSKRTVGFSNKVSRLSLQFGSATYATIPESFGLSQVRSLAFIGLKSCYASILEFKVLRFLILHMWADEPSNTGVDLEPTSKLVLLRSLQVTCNDTVYLPDLMQGPKHLETLEINARVAAIPANIVHLRSWLHLRLGVGAEVPDLTGTLKIVTPNPAISLDDSSCPRDSVKTMELSSPICRIPKWIAHLANLCILKFVVAELQTDDISNLQKLSFLSVLSLHVQQPTTELICFASGAFSALEYFEFRCGAMRLVFWEGAMPNLQRLKLGFNAHSRDGLLLVGVEHLLSVKEISGVIGLTAGAVESEFMAAESVFREAMGRHLNFSVEREELYVDAEKQHEIHPSTSSEQTGSPNQEYQDVRGSAEKQHPVPGKHTPTSGEQQDYQTEIKQHSSSDSQLIKRSGPTELIIEGEGDMHKLDQVLVFDKETGLEKLTLERCPPLELKHLLMLTSLKTLIVRESDSLVGPLGGQGDVEWQLPVEHIRIEWLKGISGKELTELLPHLPMLSKLEIISYGMYLQPTTSATSRMEEDEVTAADEEEDDGVLLFPVHLFDSLQDAHMFPLLQVLIIKNWPKLLGLPFSNHIVSPDWFPRLQELEIRDCPEFSSVIPISWINSLRRATINYVKLLQEFEYTKSSDGAELKVIGRGDLHSLDQVLVFDKETSLKKLELQRCPPLELKHLRLLTSLKTLIVKYSDGLVGSLGCQSDVEWQLPVEHIKLYHINGNIGKELIELLPHLPKLSKLEIEECKNIKKLVVGVDVQKASEASEMGGGEITAAAEEEDDGVLLFPAHLGDSLLELLIGDCQELVLVEPPTLVPGGGWRSLQRLTIKFSPKFLSTFSFSCHIFPSSLQSLKLWDVKGMGTLEPLSNLSSLTKLELRNCGEDLKCQGLQCLVTTGGQLKKLDVYGSPGFFADWDPRRALEDVEGGEEQQTQLVSSTLQELCTDDIAGLLAAPICSFLSSSLTKLELAGDGSEGMERFSKEQEDALQLLSSFQQLEFRNFSDLQQLPAGLHNLTSLKILTIWSCPAVSSLPNDGLPKSVQKLNVRYCFNWELTQQCRGLVETNPDIVLD